MVLADCLHAHLGGVVQQLSVGHLAGVAGQVQVAERPREQVHVQPFPVRMEGEPAVGRLGEPGRRSGAAVYRSAVQTHPLADPPQAVERAAIELAAPGRADVEQQVAALADRVHQHAHQLADALPGCFVAVISPGAGEGLARLPDYRLAVDGDPALRLPLLRGADVPAVVQVEAVVEHHVRLQLADHPVQARAVPVVAALAAVRVAEVAPQDVDAAETGQQLPYLAVQVLDVLALVALLVERRPPRVVAQGVHVVDPELGMVPVDDRVVEADAQAAGAERIHHRPDQVSPGGRVGGLVVGQRAVPQAEAVVMLGSRHEVLHAGAGGSLGPTIRVVQVGIEIVQVAFVVADRDFLLLHYPFVARRQGIQSPVNEQAEAVVYEPAGVAGTLSDLHLALLRLPAAYR